MEIDELIEAVKKLPEDQFLQLKQVVDKRPLKSKKERFRELLLNGPNFSDEQIQAMEETRKAINKWRTK